MLLESRGGDDGGIGAYVCISEFSNGRRRCLGGESIKERISGHCFFMGTTAGKGLDGFGCRLWCFNL